MDIDYEFLIPLLMGAVLGAVAAWYATSRTRKHRTNFDIPPADDVETSIYRISRELKEFFDETSHPSELLTSSIFLNGVDVFDKSEISTDRLIQTSKGSSVPIACMALEALQRRKLSDKEVDLVAGNIGAYYPWPLFFALRALSKDENKPVVGAVLSQIQSWWLDNHYLPRFIETFISERRKQGEKPSFGSSLEGANRQKIDDIQNFLSRLDNSRVKPLLSEIKHRNRTQLDEAFLNAIGRLWTEAPSDDLLVENDLLAERVELIHKILFSEPPRSVLLVGDSGVGKTVTIKALAKKLKETGWAVFEAGAADVMAGQIYIGQPEQRVQDLIKHLDHRRQVVWFIPNFHEIHYAARWRYNPVGILNMLLPFIVDGAVKVIGEVQTPAYERLVRENKKVSQSFEVVRIDPAGDRETLELAKLWINKQQKAGKSETVTDPTLLEEALALAKQYLSDQAAPGIFWGC